MADEMVCGCCGVTIRYTAFIFSLYILAWDFLHTITIMYGCFGLTAWVWQEESNIKRANGAHDASTVSTHRSSRHHH